MIVPGVPVNEEGAMTGLLFADDLEGSQSTPQGVHNLAKMVTRWCYDWEMIIGIPKCVLCA